MASKYTMGIYEYMVRKYWLVKRTLLFQLLFLKIVEGNELGIKFFFKVKKSIKTFISGYKTAVQILMKIW